MVKSARHLEYLLLRKSGLDIRPTTDIGPNVQKSPHGIATSQSTHTGYPVGIHIAVVAITAGGRVIMHVYACKLPSLEVWQIINLEWVVEHVL